jgi:hypothetical protein
VFGQGRLGVERVDVRWSAVEEEVDYAFRRARKVWLPRRQRIGRLGKIAFLE